MKKSKQLHFLIDRFYQIQDHRIAMGNQIFQLKEAKESTEKIDEFYNEFLDIEKEMEKYIKKEVAKVDIWQEFLKDVKGIGPLLAGALIILIDVHETKHVSSVWKYAGLTPDSKRVKGKKIDWNPDLKRACFKIAQSFLKSKSEYRKIYDEAKKKYRKKYPKKIVEDGKTKYNDGHIDMMARRYMVKMFLKDLWVKWREIENLPVSEPYVITHLGHDKR